jgi:glycosyltransferase involved in cell wall biosynthesis
MIVKDESHLIRGTLEMLCSKMRFDYWVICDTGSSDNTREIITQFFNEKNIRGELHCDEWVDFGHNRTLALERAFNKTDLLLVFDADDEIHGTIPIPAEVVFDEYHLKFGVPKSGMNYTRTQIINNRKRFKYLSVLHEFISCQEETPARVCILNGDYFLISGRSGSRNKDPNKYLKDATILATAHAVALAKGVDLYKRYAFYCANSYRDCGRHEDAIKWYKITLSQDNWAQEKYLSCLYVYQCYEALGQPEHGYFYLVKAFSYDNERVECLYPLIVHYCCENMNEIAYNYFRMVKMTTPQNNAGKLFVETDKAGFYVPYYMIIVADRVGDRECGIRMYEIIFKEKHRTFSAWHLRNLFHNLRFFINHVKPDALNAFAALANDYLKFVIDNGVPVSTFENLGIGTTSPAQNQNSVQMKEKIKGKCAFKNSRNILFYTGYCNVHWNYSKMKLGALGGSEKAVAHLSKELGGALGGMTIYVAGDVCAEELAEFNVVYVPMKDLPELLGRTEFHTVICSRYISFLELYGNACSFYQFYIWAHDTRLLSYGSNLSDGAIIKKWAECIDGCVCQTQWHADQYIQLYPDLKPKMSTINNGIDLELFPPSVSKQAGKFVYTSRTERGLARVLELWPEVVAALPHATLVVSTYEAFPCNDDERRIEARIESLNQEFPNNRIQHVGKLNPTQLYAEMSTAEYWLYPTNWPETSCITAMEMLMSGVICLYYPMAGLTDTMNGCGVQISPGSEIQTLRHLAHDEEKKEALRKQGRAYAESCSWATRADAWKQTLVRKRVAIFNSFPFHYELFGHILAHFARNGGASSAVSIFTETKNNMGWLDFYKTQFETLNIEFRSVSEFCDARHEFDLIFVPTDDDFAFKREWIDDRCIVTDNHVSNRRPEYKHHIGLRPFAGNDKRWALPCYDLVSASDKMTHLERDCIHVAITVGWQIVLNYPVINRLSAMVPLHIHFIGRKFDDIASKMNATGVDICIHLHEKMETRDMIELLKKCDYVMTDLQNDDHINGITMSGVVPLSFSTLTPLIISKQNNRIYGFKNVVEFEMSSDEPIVIAKKGSNHVEQLKVERDGLIAMYDRAIATLIRA